MQRSMYDKDLLQLRVRRGMQVIFTMFVKGVQIQSSYSSPVFKFTNIELQQGNFTEMMSRVLIPF